MRPVRVGLCISLGFFAVWIGPLLSAQAPGPWQSPMPSAAGSVTSESQLLPITVVLPIVCVGYPLLPGMPDLRPIDNSDRNDGFLVEWLPVLRATSYELQEDDHVEFSSPDSIYRGSSTSSIRSSQSAGAHFFRVRGINDVGEGVWSQVRGVFVPAPWGIWVIQNDTGVT